MTLRQKNNQESLIAPLVIHGPISKTVPWL